MPLFSSMLLVGTTVGTTVTAVRRSRRRRLVDRLSAESSISEEVRFEVIRPLDEEEEVNHYFGANSLLLGMTMGGLVFPPLMTAGIPINIYTTLPAVRKAYASWAEERRVNSSTVESVLVMGTMALQMPVSSTMISWGYSFGRKLKHQLRTDLKDLLNRATGSPKVWAQVDEVEMQMPLEAVENGDILIMRENSILPLAGRVTGGEATINLYLIAMESEERTVGEGDMVPPLAIVTSGRITVQVVK